MTGVDNVLLLPGAPSRVKLGLAGAGRLALSRLVARCSAWIQPGPFRPGVSTRGGCSPANYRDDHFMEIDLCAQK
jgi:hypothetical protein